MPRTSLLAANRLARGYRGRGSSLSPATATIRRAVRTALAALPELGPRTRDVVPGLLPGGVTLLLPNPAGRFPLAGVPDAPTPALGLRVPALTDATVGVTTASQTAVTPNEMLALCKSVPKGYRKRSKLVVSVAPVFAFRLLPTSLRLVPLTEPV